VVSVLQAELPQLKTFVTLSPAPGFGGWLSRETDPRAVALRAELEKGGWQNDPAEVERLRPEVEAVAARYFTMAKSRRGAPYDPVARFHLGNGAAAWRVNWPADLAPGAVKRAHALMINYLYDPAAIETQHEAFVRDGTIATGAPVASVLLR
jgi:malonyl-CoA decarboxylase